MKAIVFVVAAVLVLAASPSQAQPPERRSAWRVMEEVMWAISDRNCTALEHLLDDRLEFERNFPTDPSGERWTRVVSTKKDELERCYNEPGLRMWAPADRFHGETPGFPSRDRGEEASFLTTLTEAHTNTRDGAPCTTTIQSNVMFEVAEGEEARLIRVRQEYDIRLFAFYMDRCGIPFPRAEAEETFATPAPRRHHRRHHHHHHSRRHHHHHHEKDAVATVAAPPPEHDDPIVAVASLFEAFSIGDCERINEFVTDTFTASFATENGTRTVNATDFIHACHDMAFRQPRYYSWTDRVASGTTVNMAGNVGLAMHDTTRQQACAIVTEMAVLAHTVKDTFTGKFLVEDFTEFAWEDFRRECQERCHAECY